MLRSLKSIEGYGLRATDGELGKTKDFYFDDASWKVRYAVVDTRRWLPGRRVLISPVSFEEPRWESTLIPTMLTMEQVRDAPSADEARPVSRQHELELATHYAWPVYWIAPAGMAMSPVAAGAVQGRAAVEEREPESREGDSNLRSMNEVTSYAVEALDGEVGSVADFIVDTEAWKLRYLVADTRKWLPGGKVLLALEWIESIDWDKQAVTVDLEEERIRACPPYRASDAVNRDYEEVLYDFYGRPRYWV